MAVIEEKRMKIADLQFEVSLWLNEFKFYKEEIAICTHRLEEIVSRTTDNEAMKEVEHFQNQYIRQTEVIDELRHEVKQHENNIEKETPEQAVDTDNNYFEDHNALREQVVQFKKIYADLKKEFMHFLA